MNKIKLNHLFFPVFFALLIGCGGGTIDSAKDLEEVDAEQLVEVKNIEQNIVGYWVSANPKNPEFEFYASTSEINFETQLKQGRVFVEGKQTNSFYWQLQSNGIITLTLIDSLCSSRPLNTCRSTGLMKIQVKGSSILNSTWTIRNEDLNERLINGFAGDYNKKYIDFSALDQGEFFLSDSEVFNLPVTGKVEGNTISLLYNPMGHTRKISANIDAGVKADIKFNVGSSLTFYETAEFFIDGIGYRDLQVKQWYEDVVLSASNGEEYTLRMEWHREVQPPENVDPARIHLGDYRTIIKTSKSYVLINKFIDGVRVKPTDKFFSFFAADLGNDSRTFNGFANELLFVSNETVTASLVDEFEGPRSNTARRSYSWVQDDDGTIFLKPQDPGGRDITVRFIKPINGGYNVLYSYSDGTHILHDLILDAPSVVNESTFAGRYMFTSNDGWTPVEIEFHKDKTVTSVPSIVNGYWFQDANGDIVSFECTTLERRDISNYAECYASFERLSEMAFVHIRRLGFIHQDGNNYNMRYAASFYGDIFNTTSLSDDYLSLGWTYRWVRVGDSN